MTDTEANLPPSDPHMRRRCGTGVCNFGRLRLGPLGRLAARVSWLPWPGVRYGKRCVRCGRGVA